MSALSRGRLLRGGAGLLVLVGLAGLLWAGLSASPYYAPFDPRQPCLVDGLCDPAVVDAGQRTWWVRAVLAGAVVLVGLAVAVAARPARSGSERPRRAPAPWPRAAAAGGLAAAVAALGALPLALATLAAPQLGAAVVAWLAVSQAWVLDWLGAPEHGLAGRPRARLAGAVAAAGAGWLVAGGLVLVVGADVLAIGVTRGLLPMLLGVVALDGLVVALVVAALLVVVGRREPATPGTPDAGSGGGRAGSPPRTAVPHQRGPRRASPAEAPPSRVRP